MKKCKQCLEELPDESFKPYVPRGKGIRQTTVGRHTYCRDCEKLNSTATRIWKRGPKTDQEEAFLRQVAAYYKRLVETGGRPAGAYAASVLEGYPKAPPRSNLLDELLAGIAASTETKATSTGTMEEEPTTVVNPLQAEFERIMAMSFDGMSVEEVEELVDNWDDLRSSRSEYREQYLQLLTKQDEYTDRLDEESRSAERLV